MKRIRYTDNQKNEAINRVMNGETLYAIHKDTGISTGSLRNWIQGRRRVAESRTPKFAPPGATPREAIVNFKKWSEAEMIDSLTEIIVIQQNIIEKLRQK